VTFNENSELFLEEARELLTKTETSLLELERHPGDRELVNEVFRALHTIKGSGAMFGFAPVSEFTHQVENLFDEVRKGKLAVDAGIIDIGLRAADCINQLLNGESPGQAQAALLEDIERRGRGGASEPPEVPIVPPLAPPPPPSADLPLVWRIHLKPQSQILNRGVKLEALFRDLEELGTCHVAALTEDLPDLEDLDPTALHLSWSLTLATTSPLATIQSVFMFVEDYMTISIVPVELTSSGGSATPKLGEILVSRGHMDESDVEAIREIQRSFGEIAVTGGKVRQEHIEAAIAEQSLVRSTNTERESRQESATIRVRKEKLDGLIDLVGELVILQAVMELEAKKVPGAFDAIAENLARLAADLRDTTMSIRMVPLEESFTSFQRLVRDLSQQVGKELRLEISGGSTELDKNIIEALKDPLLHIIRNTADHGIEPPEVRKLTGKPAAGTIAIAARQVGSRVEISVKDDGAGLNMERIKARAVERKLLDPAEFDEKRIMNMIFEPGFSTAEKTTGLSGRGVGMDVVKRNIEGLRGVVSLASVAGQGTTITLSIPLTLVIIEGLLVSIDDHVYVVTLSQVQECVDLTPDIQIGRGDEPAINLRGKVIPVIGLRRSLGVEAPGPERPRLVIVNNEGEQVALMVDAVVGRKQVVIKPLSAALRRIRVLSGATILGDGSVALILDVGEIVKRKQETQLESQEDRK
jgi:two-component system chemotaxis sensor kinase CheA